MKSIFSLKYFLKKSFVIHPFLFAAFFIVFLYAHNIRETSVNQILMPLGASLALALVLWVFLSVLIKDIVKAGLTTSIFVFLFFIYGRFYELLENVDFFVPKHGHLLPGILLAFGYCVYFLKLARRDFRSITKILNIVAVVLIAINLFNIGFYHIRTALSAPLQPADLKQALANEAINREKLKTMPDIYFIILDEYSHPDTMEKYYAYDNQQFINHLKDAGFFIANKSKTRSPMTPEIIAGILNMEYLTEGWNWDPKKMKYAKLTSHCSECPHDPAWSEPVFRKYAYGKVAIFLRKYGYKYICFGNYLGINRWNSYLRDHADFYFNYYETVDNLWISEFLKILWDGTMLKPFYQYLAGSEPEISYRRGVLSTFEHIKTIPSIGGPKFVLAHFMCPHAPFVFGSNGEYVAPVNWNNFKDKQFYLKQYIFISREIEKMVDEILIKSATEPIIIIQSDHGIRPHHPREGHSEIRVGKDEWRKILNAYYLPGDGKKLLYDSISPVNSFRLIFKIYFNADYDLLED